MYYFELALKGDRTLEQVVSNLELALTSLEEVEKNFKTSPSELRELTAKCADFLEKIETEIEENRQQEEYEKEALEQVA